MSESNSPLEDDTEGTPLRSPLERAIFKYRMVFLTGLMLWIAILLGGGLYLSGIEARVGLHIFGANQWVAGETAVFRIARKDLKLGLQNESTPVKLIMEHESGEVRESFELSDISGSYTQGVIRLPDRPGRWTGYFSGGQEGAPMRAELDMVLHAPRAHVPPLVSGTTFNLYRRSDTGETQMSLRPLDGRMSGGLADGHVVVTGETADGQVPEALELRVKEGELAPPPPKTIPLGKAGYATFPLQLMSLNTLMELHHEGSSAWRSFNLESIQFSIELESPVITPGTLLFVLHSALSSGPVFVDLWWGDRWISSTAMELDGVRVEGQLEVPDYLPDGAIVWMRAYRECLSAREGQGVRHLLVHRGDSQSAAQGLALQLIDNGYGPETVIRRIAEDTDPNLTHIRALLGFLPWQSMDPPLLADATYTVMQTVNALKAQWQGYFITTMWVTGIVLLIVLLVLLRRNHKEVQNAWDNYGEQSIDVRGTRKRLRAEALLIILLLGAFLYGLMELMLFVEW